MSVHPNRGGPPESALGDWLRLRELVARFAPPERRGIPLLSSEWGYPTHTKGVAEEVQASYLVRQHLLNLLAGAPISIWYDWKDDGPDPDVNEHRFGTVRADLEPKPAYAAARTLTRLLRGGRILRRMPVASGPGTGSSGPGPASLEPGKAAPSPARNPSRDDFVLLAAANDGTLALVAWTVAAPREAAVEVGDLGRDRLDVVEMDGRPGPRARVEAGPLRLALGPSPR